MGFSTFSQKDFGIFFFSNWNDYFRIIWIKEFHISSF